MLRQLFNYYMVLKTCWLILLFKLIGVIGLLVMDQGKDILQALSFTGEGLVVYHTWFALLAALWWGWQSWRAARAILHFTTFNFISFNKRFALQAEVLVPRILGVTPILIFGYGIFNVTDWSNPLVYVCFSLAAWMYVFFYFRKTINVFIKSKIKVAWLQLPDYISIKTEAYPAQFIWQKQRKWMFFRISILILFFVLVIVSPVRFPQFIGASGIIIFALGAWLAVASLLDFAEKHFQFPFTFTLVVMVVVFSFFNNNHKIRTIKGSPDARPNLANHFDKWYLQKKKYHNDTVPIILVAGQGGGVRSSYWTAQVLSELQNSIPQFDAHIYAFSGVSGGCLGISTYKELVKSNEIELSQNAHQILSKDFFAPVSAGLVFPDLFQKFIPFPIATADRARALEHSWEYAGIIHKKSLFQDGFLAKYNEDSCVYLFNSTRVENGFRTLVSNVKIERNHFSMTEDFFDVTKADVPLSTALSVCSRFPFITPPALVYNGKDEKWGNLVDGGYIENMGATAMLEMYEYLREYAQQKKYKVKFRLLFIKNTKEEYTTRVSGLYEILAPINTFSKVWVNSGYYDETNLKMGHLYSGDEAYFVSLDREEDKIIPLGWYLSEKATTYIRQQVAIQTADTKNKLKALF